MTVQGDGAGEDIPPSPFLFEFQRLLFRPFIRLQRFFQQLVHLKPVTRHNSAKAFIELGADAR